MLLKTWGHLWIWLLLAAPACAGSSPPSTVEEETLEAVARQAPIATPSAQPPVGATPTPVPEEVPETPIPQSTSVPLAPASPTPTVVPTPDAIVASRSAVLRLEAGPPERDLFELAQRFRLGDGDAIPRTIDREPVSYETGHQQDFWVIDSIDRHVYTVQADLQLVSENAYWYVDDRLEIPIDHLKKAAEVFEDQIRPTIVAALGDIWSPGVDNDTHLTVLHTPLRGAAGYFGSPDEYPREVHPHSNQREMIYMDGELLLPGSAQYLAILTHEFQHAVHWNADPGEDAWINEGLSEVATHLAGYESPLVRAFLENSTIQLTRWPDLPENSAPHYGGANLFLSFLAQHYGGYEGLKDLVQEPADGIEGVENYLWPQGLSFLDVFKDWVIANYLDAPEGPYSYPDRDVRVRDVRAITEYGEVTEEVPQFAARYIDVQMGDGDVLLGFRGQSEVNQVATQCHSGSYCWWGNRGDSIDSTLTREFDLSNLSGATLEFWTWFSVEEDWDYAYVEVSTDDGASWTILKGGHTTSENPIGNSYGHGFTGETGDWVREEIDLTPYIGSEVLIRFEYITDDAVHLDGFLVDDVAIRELSFLDDAEDDRGWAAEGFLRIDNTLPQEYVVRIIEKDADNRVSVHDFGLEHDNAGEAVLKGFGARLHSAVVVVAPATRGTHQPAEYTLTVSRAGD